MSKLQKYNRIAFAVISVPTFITMCIVAFMMICGKNTISTYRTITCT